MDSDGKGCGVGKDVDLGDISVSLEGGDEPLDIDLSVDMLDPTITFQGGTPIATDSTINVPDPVRMENKLEGGEPIRTDLSLDVKPLAAAIDVKPVVADLCFTIGVSNLPATSISAPFSTHLGLTLFGVEVVGLSVAGNNVVRIEPLPTPPSVVHGGTGVVRHHHRGSGHRATAAASGLNIRLDG